MDLERFRQSSTGRLVKVGQGEAAYWAFVPAPLPPALEYGVALVRLLSDADCALGELSGLARTMPNPHLLTGPFIRRESVLSSRIEGTQTDLPDLYAYEVGQPPLSGRPRASADADRQEVHNYVRALEYGLERLDTLPLSLRFIRELHERLMGGVRGEEATPGEFRRSQNWIGAPGSTLNGATYVPPPVPEMHEALDAFERYLHRDDGNPAAGASGPDPSAVRGDSPPSRRQWAHRALADLAALGALEPAARAASLPQRLLRAPPPGLLRSSARGERGRRVA